MAGRSSSTTTTLLLVLSVLLLHLPTYQSLEVDIGIGIGIGIGAGGDDSSPSPCACAPPEPLASDFPNLKQYAAYKVIQRFKRSLTCDPKNITATWVGRRICDDYTGIYCDTPPNSPNTTTVASIDFNGFRLCAPTLSNFIDALPDLALFHANSNSFSGTVPDLTALPFFYELDVSNNNLTGPFPAAVLPLSRLVFLDLRFNSFAGSVPRSIFTLDLDVLFLNNNGFKQPLPANLGSTSAAYLTLANNGFTGPIPKSLANSSIVEILLLNNSLSGCLPCEVGLLRQATVFDAGFNRLTGPLPPALACLSKVEQLNLAGNLLSGEVPDVVCRLAEMGNLENLSLSGNYFTSLGHSCWGLVRSGVLDVEMNCVPGLPKQRGAADCAQFFMRPRLCPYFSYIPCHGPKLWGGAAPPPPPARRPKGPRAYTTYTALHKHGRP